MSPRTSKRKRVAEGIYADNRGLAAIVSARLNGKLRQRERLFPRDTPLKTIKAWRTQARADLAKDAPMGGPHSLAADAERYIRQIGHLASWRERRSEIRAWVAAVLPNGKRLGTLRRSLITREHLSAIRMAWLTQSVAPKTINNRVSAIRDLYHVLDGEEAPTPADGLRPLARVSRQPPQPVTVETIRTVLATLLEHERHGFLRDAKSRARYMVLVSTGRRPSEIMRVTPGDLDLARGLWYVRTGKGGDSPPLPMTPDMREAWQLFAEADAWGRFETSSLAKVLRHAGWPTGVRPYQARHTVGITLADAGIDYQDIGAWLGHTRTETTRQYYTGIRQQRLKRVADTLALRSLWAVTPPE